MIGIPKIHGRFVARQCKIAQPVILLRLGKILDTVELVMAFEEEFGCEIPDDAAEKILTVKDAINYIETKA